jgi:hypothetical protein
MTGDSRDTIPSPPPVAEDLVIPKGQARAAVVLALAELARAIGHVESLLHAMARGLDSEAP